MADANAVDYSSMRLRTHLQSVLGDITDPGSPPPIDDRMDTWAEDGDGEQSENVRVTVLNVDVLVHLLIQHANPCMVKGGHLEGHLDICNQELIQGFFDYSSEEEAHPPSENMLQMALQQQQALLVQSQKALHVANQQNEELQQCNE